MSSRFCDAGVRPEKSGACRGSVPVVTTARTGEARVQRGDVATAETRQRLSLAHVVRMRIAFVRRAYEALGRHRRHRTVTARIAAAQVQERGSGRYVTRRLHRCPWCGSEAAYLFSYEVSYPDEAVLSERWQCAHCGGDHTRTV